MRSELGRVRPEWVDHYGHMNLAYYLVVFDLATDAVWPDWGLGPALRAQGLGTFAVESWQAYRREVVLDAPLEADSALLAFDAKRLLLRHRLYHAEEGFLSAENEVLYLCVDLATRRVAAWPDAVLARFALHRVAEAPQRLALTRRGA
ncbi:acyl-CoA thioesterase [Falsiroseomonas selenitidurans]|uniref:Thioesterase n=1 Tax=Falsiroseomonas selenitidurans TaxID=2716335 RepID=A0ABX1E676_9PROT|nr:thioesterase family protein [Falsiroseomonas selenitidurans]NKC31272.1 thioesterase [Falsiroseomonas selenitidurans]